MIEPIKIQKNNDPRRVNLPEPVLVAHQPEFLPWLSFLSKATMGDVYFILDTIQFKKETFQNRNKIRIKNEQGWQWLTIPLVSAKKQVMNWPEIKIDNKDNWKKKHLNSIRLSYGKAPYFSSIFSELEEIYNKFDGELLVEFVELIMKYAFKKFNVNIPIYRTSELKNLGFDLSGQKSDLIIKMCKIVQARSFVFGQHGRRYIEKEKFFQNDIKFVFQKFEHPVYSQIHGEFISQMSFIDLLFNHGEKSISILKNSTTFSDIE